MRQTAKLIAGASTLAILAGGPIASAQEDSTLRQDTVTVTGSFIKGTPEDAALPVDTLTADELKLEGNPTITELIRNLGVSSGTDGQSNQFSSNGLEGTANINLRGLGPGRTLVLINGKRQTFSPYGIGEQAQLFVDTNTIPSAAIGRVEVLKDGAAALYGSDAIAGVVNFITRDDLEGLEISGDYSSFDGSDGEYNVSASYGWQGENSSWVTTVGYSFRSEASLIDTLGTPTITENEVAGFSSLSNPGRYVVIGATGTPIGAVVDAGCTDVGGVIHPTIGDCRFQFTQYDNLVEEEERLNIFSEFNHTFSSGVELHIEGMYATTEVPEWKTSPSYPPQVLTSQFLPATHPGYQQYIADNPGTALDSGIGALFIGRIFGWGGNPMTGGAGEGYRKYDTMRLASDLSGEFENGISWDVGLGYSRTEGERASPDAYINGLTAALSGFGVCADPITGAIPTGAVPGQGGCEYYNPFSNGIPANGVTGAANPNYVAGLENTATLADWLIDDVGSKAETSLLTFDTVFSGASGVQAAGGEVGWAAGFQIRRENYKVDPFVQNDLDVNPGPGGNGPFSFLAGANSADEEQTIYAIFGELQIPLYDDIDVQVAVRYEDYGGDIGSTFDPKVAAKWQVNDFFALRGSAQTSFRGPTLNQTTGRFTTLQFIAPTSAFKAVDTFSNPDLKPESAFSFNVGGIFENDDGLYVSVDYYNFDFSDPIIVEDHNPIVDAAIAALATATTDDDGILNRVEFNDPLNPSATTISRVITNITNGPDIKTSGIDLRIEKSWNIGSSQITAGTDATYMLEYEVGDFGIEDIIIAGGDRVGQFNRSNFSRSLPQWKANFYLNYNWDAPWGNNNLRAVVRHVDSYKDERGDTTPLNNRDDSTLDAMTTVDLYYLAELPHEFELGLSVANVFDEDPPYAQFDTNYDPYTHSPFGRTFKVSLRKSFSGL